VAGLKTKPRTASAQAFLDRIKDDERRQDSATVARLMTRATNAKPRLWGSAIVGFGDFRCIEQSVNDLKATREPAARGATR
jgi:hypothetical protein